MFYHEVVLAQKGPLARIWLAAHWDKKLNKAQITETDVETSCKSILVPEVPIALRTSGHLLLGVVKIYSRKVKYVLQECNEAITKIKLQVAPATKVDLPEKATSVPMAQITLPVSTSTAPRDFDLLLPDIDLGAAFALPERDEEQALNLLKFRLQATTDEFDRWESTEETGPLELTLFPGIGRITPVSVESVEAARREVPASGVSAAFAAPVEGMDFDFNIPGTDDKRPPSETSEDRISRVSPVPAGEDLGLGGMDFGGMEMPFGEEAPVALVAAPAAAVAIRPRKRVRLIEDANAEINMDELKALMKDPSPLLITPGVAPRTSEELERLRREPQTIEALFRTPSITGLGDRLAGFFASNLREVKKRRLEQPSVPAARFEEAQPADFGGFEMPLGAEEEITIPTEAERRRRETMAIEEPIAVERMVEEDITSIGHEEESVAERESRVELEQQQFINMKHKFAAEKLTDRTIKIAQLFKENFRSQPDETAKLSLREMLTGRKKSTAARCFYELLVLRSRDLVTVEQERPFSDIYIGRTDRLMSE